MEKIYFNPGDIVIVRHDIPHKPKMYVTEKVAHYKIQKLREVSEQEFVGMKCRWFTSTGMMQEAVFNTKDLEMVNRNE